MGFYILIFHWKEALDTIVACPKGLIIQFMMTYFMIVVNLQA